MKLYIKLLAVVSLFMGCNSPDSWDLFKSTGHARTVTRYLQDFHSVIADGNVEFQIVVQDTISKIEITAGKNLLPKIKSDVTRQTLIVRNNNKYDFVRSSSRVIRMKIYTKTLNSLQTNTARNFYVFSSRYLDSLVVFLPQCSGDLFASIKVGSLKIDAVESVSKIEAIGSADTLKYAAGYSYGPVDLGSLATKMAIVIQNGSNDLHLNVQDSLRIAITGIGNVYYKGNPLINSTIIGKGRLIKELY